MKFSCVHLLLLLAGHLCAQEPVYYNYRSNHGLPSNEVYNVRTDSAGFLWFATDRGVARFDGSRFVNYSVNDGITGNVVNDVFTAPNGDIWVVADSRRLYRFTGSGFEAYPYNHLIAEVCAGFTQFWIGRISFENNWPAWFSIISGGLLHIGRNGQVQYNPGISQMQLEYDSDKQLAYYYHPRTFRRSADPSKNIFHFRGSAFQLPVSSMMSSLRRSNGTVLVSLGEYLFELKEDRLIRSCRFSNFITNIFEDKEQRLWVNVYGPGIRMYQPGVFPDGSNEQLFFSDTRISSMLQDREGGFWFTSYEKGAIYVPRLDVKSISCSMEKPGEALQELVAAGNGVLYLATSARRFLRLTGDRHPVTAFTVTGQETTNNCNDLVADSARRMLYGCYSQGVFSFNLATGRQQHYRNSARSVLPAGNSFHVLSPASVTLYNSLRNIYEFTDKTFFSIVALSGSSWLIGYERGLLMLKDGAFRPVFESAADKRVTAIRQLPNGWMVAATLGKGLLVFKDSTIVQVQLGQRNAQNMVNDIAVSGNTVMAATEAGIARAKLDDPYQPVISTVPADDRFPYSSVRKLAFQDGKLYLLAQNQLIVFPEHYRANKIPPPVILQQVIVGDTLKLRPGDTHRFSYRDNRLRFVFDGVCFSCGTGIRYKYRLSGLHTDWYYTGQPYVEYPPLPPGSYSFEVMAVNENDVVSEKPAVWSFTIPAPFWQRGWFMVLSVLLSVLLAGWLVSSRLKKIQLRNREKELLLAKEQVALSAQISPHFIFNSLNSIQHLIIQEDRQHAVLHMSQFSRLMRLSLDNSRKKWVHIKEELELLELYLQLEKLRFRDKFVYHLEVDESLRDDNGVRIPAMLIQPFVENAIRHGVNNLTDREGVVTVSLQWNGDVLEAAVDDNGVGREKARLLQGNGQDHLSAGMQITEERLKLLCRETGTNWFFEIIDKSGAAGAAGTLVRFNMPYLHAGGTA